MTDFRLLSYVRIKTIIALVMMVYFSFFGFINYSSFAQSDSNQVSSDSIKKKDDKISQTVYKWFGRQNVNVAPLTNEETVNRFLKYEGKVISQISIVRFDAFGYSVYDTTIKPERSIEKFGNNLHLKTRKKLFKTTCFSRKAIRLFHWIWLKLSSCCVKVTSLRMPIF